MEELSIGELVVEELVGAELGEAELACAELVGAELGGAKPACAAVDDPELGAEAVRRPLEERCNSASKRSLGNPKSSNSSAPIRGSRPIAISTWDTSISCDPQRALERSASSSKSSRSSPMNNSSPRPIG